MVLDLQCRQKNQGWVKLGNLSMITKLVALEFDSV